MALMEAPIALALCREVTVIEESEEVTSNGDELLAMQCADRRTSRIFPPTKSNP